MFEFIKHNQFIFRFKYIIKIIKNHYNLNNFRVNFSRLLFFKNFYISS
jgi:hypothetical protein